ncbi:hypothetical protein ACFPRL_21910 [Pseudoclavibacter helvolus]
MLPRCRQGGARLDRLRAHPPLLWEGIARRASSARMTSKRDEQARRPKLRAATRRVGRDPGSRQAAGRPSRRSVPRAHPRASGRPQ